MFTSRKRPCVIFPLSGQFTSRFPRECDALHAHLVCMFLSRNLLLPTGTIARVIACGPFFPLPPPHFLREVPKFLAVSYPLCLIFREHLARRQVAVRRVLEHPSHNRLLPAFPPLLCQKSARRGAVPDAAREQVQVRRPVALVGQLPQVLHSRNPQLWVRQRGRLRSKRLLAVAARSHRNEVRPRGRIPPPVPLVVARDIGRTVHAVLGTGRGVSFSRPRVFHLRPQCSVLHLEFSRELRGDGIHHLFLSLRLPRRLRG
mmetsp:Transcript_4857/g.11982  ORF Transcript_4857/g.11982 Transcript_4857/m.11982 type:complete len:259 (+) Transcript_4857:637-1413(+)